MIDEEIASLLEDAGYRFNSQTGRYDVLSGVTDGEEEGHSSEYVADELGIPVEDLQRFESAQAGFAGDVAVEGETPPET